MNNIQEHINNYAIKIYEKYTDLKNSGKQEFTNNDLWKIFEFYICIKLTIEYNRPFYEYADIEPNFKEINKMSQNDTGIDCCDLLSTIVQAKRRENSLAWKECSTFFGSQNIFSDELKKTIIRWENLIIARNLECKLSPNLIERKDLFIDKQYDTKEMIEFCENLIVNPPKYPILNEDFKLRDYQTEAIKMIQDNKKNVIINLPTGTGKNSVIIYSMKDNLKNLIIVPRIILMEQIKAEIIKHKPQMKSKIQLIGDGKNKFDENKLITICVFNSIHLITDCSKFEKIYIDEAHHISKPIIYCENEENNIAEEEIEEIEEIEEEIEDDYESEEETIDNETDGTNETDETDETEDTEDELKNIKNYTKLIKDLAIHNNNVYLSATIDKIKGFEYYSKDIREMINLKYLCDYTIQVPIFSNDPTDKNTCEYLLKIYRNIIIYCNSQKEGKLINKLLNELQPNSSEYIDCLTPKKERNIIIDKYKKGIIPFLVNVRILVEGFDAPITKGVCFLHLPTNKTVLIQIIGRCLRLHPTKTIANIILPFSSKEDEKSICNFLKVISQNDTRIKKSYESKKIGGYISIVNIEENIVVENNDVEFKYNMIYNSLGVLLNSKEIWRDNLKKSETYINVNGYKPSAKDTNNEIRKLGFWIKHQINNYKKKINIMKNEDILQEWIKFTTKYKQQIKNNTNTWINKLNCTTEYIKKNNKKPSQYDVDKQIKSLGKWLLDQINNYENKINIMKNDNIYKLWTEFINNVNYKKYFKTDEQIWIEKINYVKTHIKENNKKPSKRNNNSYIKKIGHWLSDQIRNYKNKNKNCLMRNEHITKLWEEFINDKNYKKYFLNKKELWHYMLNETKTYITENNKMPSKEDNDKETIELCEWISTQKLLYAKNYKAKTNIMSNKDIHKEWTNFITDEKYKQYFNNT